MIKKKTLLKPIRVATRSKSESLARIVARAVLLVLMNVQVVTASDSIRYVEQGTIPFRQRMTKK